MERPICKCSERKQFETVAPIDRQMTCHNFRIRAPTPWMFWLLAFVPVPPLIPTPFTTC